MLKDFQGDQLPEDMAEYGYGLWLRFLVSYPKRLLLGGKSAPFYFVARLSKNKQPGDLALGDRVLAIFQG
jgi:hypothetical protein